MPVTQRVQRHAAVVTLVVACLAAAVGIMFFVMAMRPCRVDLRPGTEISYRLTTSITPIDADGSPLGDERQREDALTLLALSDEREVALLTSGQPGRRDEVALLRIDPDGRVRRFADDLSLLDEGKALQFFDFNLMPLPEGLEQHWRTSVVYAALPPDRRMVQVRVRRVESGLRSVFEMRPLSPIDWVDDGPPRRYRQVEDLVARYRFNGGEGYIDAAEIRFVVGAEVGDGRVRRHLVEMRLDGQRIDHGGDNVALRDLAMATVEAQTAVEDGRPERLRPLLARLHADEGAHPRLRELAGRLATEAGRSVPGAPRSGWVVHVASYQPRHRNLAENLVRDLSADGYPSFMMASGDYLTVCVGPYDRRRDEVAEALQRRFPDDRPYWRRVE